MTFRSKLLLLLLGALMQAACSNQAVYTGESFASDSPFKMRTDGDVALACESARRSLLGQGYLIESASNDGVKGRKAYRTEDTQNTFIEMNIVCLPDASGSSLFATGVLSTYALKKSSSSASVGLSALGSISLPIGQSADSLVKVSEETIDDKDFYKRFFAAVEIILGEMRAGKAEPVPATTTPVPPVAPPAAAPIAPVAQPVITPAPDVPPAPAAPTAPPAIVPAAAPAPGPVSLPPATVETLEPFPTPAAPTVAPAQETVPAAPVKVPAPQPSLPEETLEFFPVREAATTAPLPDPRALPEADPAAVLEEFAAPRSEPFE